MRVAYFDCTFGAAGDMLLGALLQAGLPQQDWLNEVAKIAVPPGSVELTVEDTHRGTIAAKKVQVRCTTPAEERHLAQVLEIIERSAIAKEAKARSQEIFRRLAQAEARVHGVSPEAVHFHEVGALDAIVDIVGFAIGFHLLGISKTHVSPLVLGSGTTQMEHGLCSVPAPAVLNLIQQARAPVKSSAIDFECLTPTAAAILTTIADAWGSQPDFERLTGIGYGAGTRDPREWPNVTRVLLGESGNSGAARFDAETVMVVEANLDDATPQSLSFAMDRLFAVGALDVTVTPTVMKKGRSGHQLSVLCKPESQHKIQDLILLETTTIGVRCYAAQRTIAQREWHTVQLPSGPVRVKVARDRNGKVINAQPEFDDCAEYALINNLPLKEVLAKALAGLDIT